MIWEPELTNIAATRSEPQAGSKARYRQFSRIDHSAFIIGKAQFRGYRPGAVKRPRDRVGTILMNTGLSFPATAGKRRKGWSKPVLVLRGKSFMQQDDTFSDGNFILRGLLTLRGWQFQSAYIDDPFNDSVKWERRRPSRAHKPIKRPTMVEKASGTLGKGLMLLGTTFSTSQLMELLLTPGTELKTK